MPCPQCGDSVERVEIDGHACDPDRRTDFQMFALREEVAALEPQLLAFLETSAGRFERWLAARHVRR